MGDQNQDGGTSTPGKRPGCSVHVLSLKNARLAKPHSLLPYHASPRTPMDYGSLDYANYIQLCRITTSRSTVFISSPYHHLALSPAASCQQLRFIDTEAPRSTLHLFPLGSAPGHGSTNAGQTSRSWQWLMAHVVTMWQS